MTLEPPMPERPPQIPGIRWVNVGPCPLCGEDWWLGEDDDSPSDPTLAAELLGACSDCR